VREIKNKSRDEEAKKVNQAAKIYEQKLKMLEEAKETVMMKNS
jgi:hypothetical protein